MAKYEIDELELKELVQSLTDCQSMIDDANRINNITPDIFREKRVALIAHWRKEFGAGNYPL